MESTRSSWGSRTGFILAAAGSAVGLGNIWKFPYITGENGGGLFVLIYLVCIALVGIPIMMAEIMIGRAGQAQPVVAFEKLQGKRTPWSAVGWLGVIAGFIILSYYIVVAGWAMDFTLKSVVNVTEPIHDRAEIEGSAYRVTTPLNEMVTTLAWRHAEREWKDPVNAVKNRARPSVWHHFDRYQETLQKADIPDVGATNRYREAWRDTDPAVLDALEITLPAAVDPTGEVAQTYAEARAKLFEDATFESRVRRAEELAADIEAVKKAHLLEALALYQSKSPQEIRDEAEAVHRRSVIYDEVSACFGSVAVDGWTSTFWSAVFMFMVILIVGGGVSGGIERTCQILMPTLILLILIMVIYGAFKEGFGEAISFVFKPDITKLKASGVLEALGHAFFTLSLGMGAMITYGSYQQTKKQLLGQSVMIAVLDTGIALLACLMIFPIVFSYGQEADAGPGLVFKSMPLAFAEIGKGGMLLAILFFGLLVFAALTSAISLLEVVASYFIDKRGWSRHRAAWVVGGVIFVFGVCSAFAMDASFLLSSWTPSFGKNFFDTIDYLASNWLLPLGGLFIAIYVGWAMPRRLRDAEIEDLPPFLRGGWLLLVRFIAPALVILVLMQKVGILDADEVFHMIVN
jgi:NSS family neurotransmitter:Na+ symporter